MCKLFGFTVSLTALGIYPIVFVSSEIKAGNKNSKSPAMLREPGKGESPVLAQGLNGLGSRRLRET